MLHMRLGNRNGRVLCDGNHSPSGEVTTMEWWQYVLYGLFMAGAGYVLFGEMRIAINDWREDRRRAKKS